MRQYSLDTIWSFSKVECLAKLDSFLVWENYIAKLDKTTRFMAEGEQTDNANIFDTLASHTEDVSVNKLHHTLSTH